MTLPHRPEDQTLTSSLRFKDLSQTFLDPGVLPSLLPQNSVLLPALLPQTSTSGQGLFSEPTLGLISESLFRTTPQGATPMATTLLPPVLAVWWSLTATPTCRPMPVCSPPVTIQAPM